jgi:transposase
MPKAHRHYVEWTPQRLILWAAKTGAATAQVVETILTARPHPQQGFRACLGIMRLGKRYGDGRLEAACHRAIRIGAGAYKSIESMLQHDLDRQPVPGPPAAAPVITHDKIRGAPYYHSHQGEPPC